MLYLQWQQPKVLDLYRQYLETVSISKKNKKNRSLTICITKDHTVEFPAASKQFDSLKISLLYDKSDLHTTIYDSDDAKVWIKKSRSSKSRKYNIKLC